MKVQKIKDHSIYKIVNVGNGDEFFLNFRPKNKDLRKIAIDRFGWLEESEILFYKMEIYEQKISH